MTRKPKGPVGDPPPRLRQRQRADGSWRVWWEPEQAVKKLGFQTVELPADTPVRAAREARKLNDQVDQARLTGSAPRAKRGPVCIEDVVADYQKSIHYVEKLSEATKRVRRSALQRIVKKWGDVPVADFTKPMAHTWHEALYRDVGKHQAVAMNGYLSVIMSHAERRGWRPEGSNPCVKLGVSIPKGRSRAASWEEFDALQAAARRVGLPSVGVAVAMSMLAGQRQTDCVQARRGHFSTRRVVWPGAADPVDVWVWALKRSKTGASGNIMLHPELAAMVAAILSRPAPDDACLILEERVGRPYDLDLFQKRWAEVRRAAIAGGDGTPPCPSLDGMQFRDLRRSFAVHARFGGASVDDTGDVLGNSAAKDARIKGTYMPADFFTSARAVAAVNRPEPDQERNKA
jgi:integrase